jgi:hypothetical protein
MFENEEIAKKFGVQTTEGMKQLHQFLGKSQQVPYINRQHRLSPLIPDRTIVNDYTPLYDKPNPDKVETIL